MDSGAASEFIGSSCAAAAEVILLDNGKKQQTGSGISAPGLLLRVGF